LLVKHFLGSVSKNAEGLETEVEVTIGQEVFQASGITVTKPNFLQIYDSWKEKPLTEFSEGETMKRHTLKLKEGSTTAPSHLSEADLIARMDENGIGTDATIHEHIKNIQVRGYAEKKGIRLVPT
jgi:DNA topoisomerase III